MIGRDLIQRMSFTDSSGANYLFMGSYSGEAVTQPYTPTREGTSWELVDVNGKNIVAELISAARSPAGEGYVEYQYPAPGNTQPQTKISYVVGIPEWDSYIGTGMYLGDVEAENQVYLRNSLGLMTAMFVFVFLVMYVASTPGVEQLPHPAAPVRTDHPRPRCDPGGAGESVSRGDGRLALDDRLPGHAAPRARKQTAGARKRGTLQPGQPWRNRWVMGLGRPHQPGVLLAPLEGDAGLYRRRVAQQV